MQAVSNPPVAATPIPGIRHATLAGSAQGIRDLSVWSQVLEPGASTPPHRHRCNEVVMCMAGRGEVHLPGKRISFGADSTVCLPRNELHQIVNTGTEPLHLIAVFGQSPVDVFLPDGSTLELPWSS